jgi:hypothetical protein
MDKLNLPDYSFRILKSEGKKLFIFDSFRKKNVQLTPEEWVRQNILKFLTEEKGFPVSLVSIEAGVKVNRLSRRYDALIYDRRGKPLLLIECKAPSVNIQQSTFDQIVAYNLTIKAHYLLVSNGLKHYFCKIDTQESKYKFLEEIPYFDVLQND